MDKRNTVQRELVLDAVRRLHDHATAEQIYGWIHREHPSVGKGTVYRNLSGLSADGQILRVAFPGEADHFDHNVLPHFHALCRGCHRVFDVETDPLPDPLSLVREAHGFHPDGYELLFRGYCPDCLARKKQNTDDQAECR